MDRLKRYENHGVHISCPCCREDEERTRQGLAYTPADMYRLTERGMPVNNLNIQKAYYDGSPDATFYMGDERKRGVDVAELWENQQKLRAKARAAALSKKK